MNISKILEELNVKRQFFLPVLIFHEGRKIEQLTAFNIVCWTVVFPEFQKYDCIDSLVNAEMRKTHFDFKR